MIAFASLSFVYAVRVMRGNASNARRMDARMGKGEEGKRKKE